MSTTPALVLFDLDGVLVRYDRAARIAELARRSGRPPDAVAAALFHSGLEEEADRGLWAPAGYAAELSRRLGAHLALEDCIAARAVATTADTAVLRQAEAVARRARVAILTNNGRFLAESFATICPALQPLFAGRVHCSGVLGAAKPDPPAFARCAQALGVEPGAILFVDDSAANVAGARRAGLDALRHHDAATLARDLAARHLLEPTRHAP